jgi:HAD superfamily hydrolase (TIGR01509 family)
VNTDAVLFDLDGTLCRREQRGEEVYRGAFAHAGIEPFASPEALWRSLDGPPTPHEEHAYLAAGFDRLADEFGRRVDAGALAQGFLETVDDTAVTLVSGAGEALDHAQERGHVGLVTNGPAHRQSVKLEALGITDRFDVVVYAGDMPRRKPHPDPFERALAALDVSPAAAVHVGDSLEYDVAGAQNAGLQAAWVAHDTDGDPGEPTPEYVLWRLGDLRAVLGGER